MSRQGETLTYRTPTSPAAPQTIVVAEGLNAEDWFAALAVLLVLAFVAGLTIGAFCTAWLIVWGAP